MQHIPIFESFVNESLKESFWRNTSEAFLMTLLKDGEVKPLRKHFISLSEDPDSGGQDHYGDVRIEFDGEKLYAQGATLVDYEDPTFWKENPDIAQHVTGFRDADEYYSNKDYEGPEDANANHDFTWEQYCEDYAGEQELVIPTIRMESGLIRSVSNLKPFSEATKELLRSNNIRIVKR